MGKLYNEIGSEPVERINALSQDFRQQVYNALNLKETDELTEIWHAHDREAWSDLAFDVINEILVNRLGELPPPLQSLSASQPLLVSTEPIKLWSPGLIFQVGLFLGLPFGAAFASFNLWRMGMKDKIPTYMVGSIVGTIVVLFMAVDFALMGANSCSRTFAFAVNTGMLIYLQSQIRKEVDSFKAANHNVQNFERWMQVLVGLGAVGLTVTVILLLFH